ncbi:RNA ligase [Methylocaldum sp.]|uniref:RNA ligase n=1 Tax=Methylocaldum sp. TaxID=1969727 RepID=UPI002D5E7BEE|nr:RNA ligase [Methylocaldum sp.]HYE34773.1 RNA ligase [Methylocaldum sp.]
MTPKSAIDAERIQRAMQSGKATDAENGDLHYVRFIHDFEDIARGTLVFDEGTVYGYPPIGRLLALQTGLAKQLSGPFWMEEKIDGFNIRVARIQGSPIALTRGGYVCPFVTDRLPDLLDTAIFDDQPDLVLCAEVAGPDNPYMESAPPFIPEDVKLFVFDMMRRNSPRFLSQDEKIELIRRYALPSVEIFGRFDTGDVKRISAILKRLDEEEREGAVFKEDSPRQRRTKHVTASANLSDIRTSVYSLLDLSPEYFTSRILRLALFADEQELERSDDLNRRAGAAFLDGLREAIRQHHREGRVSHRFRCRFRNPENARYLIQYLKRAAGHVQVVQRELKPDGEFWLLEFDRIYPSLNGLLSDWLAGKMVFD